MSPRDWCIGRTAIVRILVRGRRGARAAGAARPRRRARRRPRPVAHHDRRSLPVHPARYLGLDELEPEGGPLPVRRLLRALARRRPGLQVLPGQGGALRGADRSRPAQGGAGLRDLQPGPARRAPRSTGSTRRRRTACRSPAGAPLPGRRVARGLRQRFPWTCDTGNSDNEIGCYAAAPADLDDAWELTRVQRLPKGGRTFAVARSRPSTSASAGVTYKVTYTPNGGSGYGGNITSRSPVLKCNNAACSNTTSVGTPTVSFTPVSDFVSWDNADTATRTATIRPSPTTPASRSTRSANNSCAGWDPNTDTARRQERVTATACAGRPTAATRAGTPFTLGDVIPLDWKTDHKVDILKRLAPNYVDSSTVA